jgi:transposase InsO family protein
MPPTGTEFKNSKIEGFLEEEGIKHEFSSPYTPQQNGVVERKNRTLLDMTRTMLDEYKTKAVEGFLLGYDSNTRAYRVFNKSTGLVEVSCDIVFDETNGS